MRRFAIRTIKNGRVKINGTWFYPDTRYLQYDGRLDGKRYAFGLYWLNSKTIMADYVNLWGTEEAYKNIDSWPGPECVDGYFNWQFWYSDKFKWLSM